MAASAFLAKIVINSCENKKLFVIYYFPFRSIFRLFWNKNFLNKIFVIKNLQTFLVFLILKSCSWKSDFFNGSHICFVAYHFPFYKLFSPDGQHSEQWKMQTLLDTGKVRPGTWDVYRWETGACDPRSQNF